MHDAPSQKEMIAAVKAFIDDTAMPNLKVSRPGLQNPKMQNF